MNNWMQNSPSLVHHWSLRLRLWWNGPFFLVAVLWLLLQSHTLAGSATWNLNPTNEDWNTAANWTPMTVPEQPSDVATFAKSNTIAVAISSSIGIDSIVFDAGASSFTISDASFSVFSLLGGGITNNSGVTQNFVISVNEQGFFATMRFTNSATAGDLTFFEIDGGLLQFVASSSAGNGTFITNEFGRLKFERNATADHGTFVSNGASASDSFGGEIDFLNSSTADHGSFTINGGGASGATEGSVVFISTSSAANASITANGSMVSGAEGGAAVFIGGSSADSATLIANGGLNGGAGGEIEFNDGSTGGTARVEVFGNGNLDISAHNAPGVTIGSIEGTGAVFLGADNLTVGSNNLSTAFSGVMQDGGQNGGTGGSLSKTGAGKLTLTNANTYTGATIVNGGTLLVKNKIGSATGTGAVQINTGTLEGIGKINGAVTVGTGTSSGAILLAGNSAKSPGILTINNTLTFQSQATYKCVLNRTKIKASKVSALGVTINSNVPFTFVDTDTGMLATGTVFTVVNNTSANPIFGTFSNLPNGSIFTSNGNNFQVSYTGGTGNDLTLTVVP